MLWVVPGKGSSLLRDEFRQDASKVIGESRERMRDDFLPGTTPQVFLIQIIGQVHVCVSFVSEVPSAILMFQNNGQVVAILKKERSRDAKSPVALWHEANVRTHLLVKVSLNHLR
jgi:hypothetical protein